jgi:hypothetical protein
MAIPKYVGQLAASPTGRLLRDIAAKNRAGDRVALILASPGFIAELRSDSLLIDGIEVLTSKENGVLRIVGLEIYVESGIGDYLVVTV